MEILENGVELITSTVEQAEQRRFGKGWNIKLNQPHGSTWLPSISRACGSLSKCAINRTFLQKHLHNIKINLSFYDLCYVSHKRRIE